MPRWLSFTLDLILISVLAFAVYFPRYRRRDLLLSYVAVNVGVMAVTVALTSTEATVGLGFGLFGILSIVRLRSAELAQQEIAYYFAALALGLLGGIEISPDWLAPTLSVVVVATMFVVDHPRLYPRYRHHNMTLDRAFTDERALTVYLEELLGGEVEHLQVKRIDLVNDATSVDVRYRVTEATTFEDSAP